ncbi:MAG: hypothetical protein ACLP3R_13585, partial [Candidatus Korobacteraceae bacterium]
MMAKSALFHNRKSDTHRRSGRPFPARGERGVALLVSLMLLTLLSVMSVVMVMTISPDMLINGYYGNYRGSFYAADSGLNIARQQLVNQLQGYVNTNACAGWAINIPANQQTTCGKAPLNTSDSTSNANTAATDAANAIVANILATSGGYGSLTALNSGTAATSWPGSFEAVNSTNCPTTFTPVANTPTVLGTNNLGQNSIYQYQFNYKLCSLGRAQSAQPQQVYTSEYGTITLMITANYSPQRNVSFAAFGGFVSNYPPNFGPLVPGTMEGPMFTNGAWQFEAGGPYIFTGPVGQVNADVDYYNNGWCDVAAASDVCNGAKIAPTFEGGLSLNQPAIPLPANDFSQQWAVLDGVGCGEGGTSCGVSTPPAPTLANMNATLKDINGNAYPAGAAPSSGVFLPYSCTGSPCVNTMNGGGVYVQGNAGVVLTMGTDSNGNLTQTYTITQGSTTTTVTTTVNAPSNAAYTKVVSGSKTVTLSGVPMNKVPTTPQQGTLLYVDGTVNSLTGPGQGQASIQ